MQTIKLRPALIDNQQPTGGRLQVPYPPEHPGRFLEEDGEKFVLPLATWWQRRLNFGEVVVVSNAAVPDQSNSTADPQA